MGGGGLEQKVTKQQTNVGVCRGSEGDTGGGGAEL